MSRKQQILELCDKVHRDLKLAGLPTDGCATDGTEHSSIAAMWSSELGFGPMASGVHVRIDMPVDEVGTFSQQVLWSLMNRKRPFLPSHLVSWNGDRALLQCT